MGRKKIWTLHLGLSFSWRMPLKTRRTSQNNLKSQGPWSTDFCPQILASSFQVKFAVSTTTCGFSHQITTINICKVLWDSAMKILTVKRRAEHLFSAPRWLLLLAFCPQSSNTMFSFDFLLTKSKVPVLEMAHKQKEFLQGSERRMYWKIWRCLLERWMKQSSRQRWVFISQLHQETSATCRFICTKLWGRL